MKGYPFEVPVNDKRVGSVVLADHVRSVDFRERPMAFAEAAPRETLDAVVALVLELVDPTQF